MEPREIDREQVVRAAELKPLHHVRQDCTIGFFYLDRHLASRPFTDADGHLLTGVGQALMTLTSTEV